MKLLIEDWLARRTVISLDEANERKLLFCRNVYGDEINHLDCRSIWTDGKYSYRVENLYYEK